MIASYTTVGFKLAVVFLFAHDWGMSRIRPQRQTLKTSSTQRAQLQIVLYVLPLWIASMLLSFFMPFTGVIGSIVAFIALFTLPFKARKGECPECGRVRLFPFSGFGGACKGCGQDIVLRGEDIHLLEPRGNAAVDGSGRGHRPTRKD